MVKKDIMENFVPKFHDFQHIAENWLSGKQKMPVRNLLFQKVREALGVSMYDESYDELSDMIYDFVDSYLSFQNEHGAVIQEKWKGAGEVQQTGEYADKTITELKSMQSKLKDKKERTAEESTKLRQINFAIRAKRDWKGDTK